MKKVLLFSSIALGLTANAQVTYCAGGADSPEFEKINNVKFANIDNASTDTPNYSDFTSKIANVQQNKSYTLTVKGNDENYGGDELLVWIDFDQNGVFDAGENVFTKEGTGPYTKEIVIPADAKVGQTRMRVKLYDKYSTPDSTGPCGIFDFGEVEDYTVDIAAATMQVSDTNKNNISVYPNPFVDVLKISDVKGVKSIFVNDATGRLVATLAPSSEINLSKLQKGYYVINLKMEDGSVKTIKTIKK